jgi:ribosomal protein S6
MKLQRTRTYECMCLLDNREVRKGWQPLKDAITALFTKHGAKILSSRRWEERRLAYPMNGQNRGTYLLVYLAVDTQAVAAIRRDLQFHEALLRWLLVDCAEVPQGAYEPEADFDVNAIPADDAPPEPPAPPAAEPVVEASSSEPATEV